MIKLIVSLLLFITVLSVFGQTTKITKPSGMYIKRAFSNTAFPDNLRANGYTYQGRLYSKEKHYSDSTVLIFIPNSFSPVGATDLIFHFHGWYNNVDSVPAQFLLPEQLHASGKNAILIIPQGPKNAPDSYGGKLEKEGIFAALTREILDFLYQEKLIGGSVVRNIILSGHSGAYRVMAHILQHGGLENYIKEVWLFDGLYSQEEKYLKWLQVNDGHFTNVYTRDGGTYQLSKKFEEILQNSALRFVKGENGIEKNILTKQVKIRNIFSPLGHNEVMHIKNQFKRLAQHSIFLE